MKKQLHDYEVGDYVTFKGVNKAFEIKELIIEGDHDTEILDIRICLQSDSLIYRTDYKLRYVHKNTMITKIDLSPIKTFGHDLIREDGEEILEELFLK